MVALAVGLIDPPAYEHSGVRLVHPYTLASGSLLSLEAEAVRKERTGIHASVYITLNHKTLAYSTFNVGRDEERTRLVNSAYQHLGKQELDASALAEANLNGTGTTLALTKNDLKHALDLFTLGLWDEFVEQYMGYMMEGDDSHAPKQIVQGAVMEHGGTIHYGGPGIGKTIATMLMAASLDSGAEKVFTLPDGPRKSLYVNLERSKESLQSRLHQVNRALGLPERRPLAFINARGRSLVDIFEALRATIDRLGIDVVFLDSISRMGGGSLIDDEAVNGIMDRLNSLARTWVVIGHTPRADSSHTFGSQMFDAAADLTVQFRAQTTNDGMTTGVGMNVVKRNDIAQPPQKILALTWGRSGLDAVRLARSGEFPDLEAGKPMTLEEQVRQFLLLRGKASAGEVANETGHNYTNISHLLNTNVNFVSIGRDGRKVLYAVRTGRSKADGYA